MTTFGLHGAVRPAAGGERASGALDPMATNDGEGAPADPWRTLMTLAAMIAVWRDLSVSLRRRIAADAVDAMNWPEAYDGPDARTAPPLRRENATTRR